MINHAQFYQLRVVVSHPRKKYGSLANPQEHTIPNLPFINHKSSPFIVGNWKYMGFIIQSQSLRINHHIDIISHPKGMKIEISLHVLVGLLSYIFWGVTTITIWLFNVAIENHHF